ncbi:phenylacetate--CoA ligase family protein [Amorphus coralli]|uniref:phenylacetate--CoA ligase family protein n=1 Tax=Amorphus coralli TaxID=340680 RepID=UPI00036AC429|nr:AMP-binding protein [Amorphus coralli]
MTTDLMLPETAEALAEAQRAGRIRAVERAQASAFWQPRLAGLDLDRITEPEEWAKIPILTKDELRALSTDAFYAAFCTAGRSETSEFWRSGGSTGRPLFYPRTHADLAHAMAGFRRVYACAGVTSDDLVHISLPLGIHPAGHMCARAAEAEGAAVMWVGAGNAVPSVMQLDLIRTFRPSVWVGMSSYAIHLANLAAADGERLSDYGIHTVICTAEPLSAIKRAKLSALWGARVLDSIGMTEMMMMGAETAPDTGFRIWSDFVYPEVVDPDTFEPVSPGGEGLLVVTALATNEATPFLRWNTGDVVRVADAAEASVGSDPGRGAVDPRFGLFPIMRHAHRTAGFFKVRGVNIGHADFEDMMFADAAIADFRVEVLATDGTDVLRVHLEPGSGTDPAALTPALTDRVRHTFEVTPDLVWCEPGSIARAFESSVKAARFVDLR